MKLFLCFALTSLAFLVANGKKIKIQIESEDLVNMFEGVIYSEILQKFASEIAKRRGNRASIKNPYHPEDELSFTDMDQQIARLSPSSLNLDLLSDSLEHQNENFVANGNSVENGDILTDIDNKSKDEFIVKSTTKNITSNSTRNSTDENIDLKKKIYDRVNKVGTSPKKEKRYVKKIYKDDRAYFKPEQRRFVLKGSNDTDTP